MFRRNTYLWSVMVVGAVVTAVGGTGIWAVFSDRATQGTNTIESGSQPRVADLQVGEFVGEACSGLSDDLATALWSVSSMQPGDVVVRNICLKSNGAAAVSVRLAAIDIVEGDAQCTGDEQIVDPACGGGPGQGQLANALQVEYATDMNCDGIIGTLGDQVGVLGTLGVGSSFAVLSPVSGLAAGFTMCVQLAVRYPSETSVDLVQAAQTDSVSWKFAFDAQSIE
jgi:hypothetical protein